MVAEVYAGLSAIKTAFDMARGLKDINDVAIRNGAVIELQEKILTAQQTQAALVERIGELEKEIAAFNKWDSEKEKYELKQISNVGTVAYMLRSDARDTKPPHWLCTNCYENGKASFIQYYAHIGIALHFRCSSCSAEYRTNGDRPAWL
jgi:hypothetical protein